LRKLTTNLINDVLQGVSLPLKADVKGAEL